MTANKKPITSDRQLAWWIGHLRRKWKEEDRRWSTFGLQSDWGSLWLSLEMHQSLPSYDFRQISQQYKCRIISEYADLPERLEVEVSVEQIKRGIE